MNSISLNQWLDDTTYRHKIAMNTPTTGPLDIDELCKVVDAGPTPLEESLYDVEPLVLVLRAVLQVHTSVVLYGEDVCIECNTYYGECNTVKAILEVLKKTLR